jgi:hypothetical protein
MMQEREKSLMKRARALTNEVLKERIALQEAKMLQADEQVSASGSNNKKLRLSACVTRNLCIYVPLSGACGEARGGEGGGAEGVPGGGAATTHIHRQ